MTTVEAFTLGMETRQQLDVESFSEYIQQLMVASYEDVSTDRQTIQYQLSDFEAQVTNFIEDAELTPQQLGDSLAQLTGESQQFI